MKLQVITQQTGFSIFLSAVKIYLMMATVLQTLIQSVFLIYEMGPDNQDSNEKHIAAS